MNNKKLCKQRSKNNKIYWERNAVKKENSFAEKTHNENCLAGEKEEKNKNINDVILAGLGTCYFQKNATFLRSFPFFIKERNNL